MEELRWIFKSRNACWQGDASLFQFKKKGDASLQVAIFGSITCIVINFIYVYINIDKTSKKFLCTCMNVRVKHYQKDWIIRFEIFHKKFQKPLCFILSFKPYLSEKLTIQQERKLVFLRKYI